MNEQELLEEYRLLALSLRLVPTAKKERAVVKLFFSFPVVLIVIVFDPFTSTACLKSSQMSLEFRLCFQFDLEEY